MTRHISRVSLFLGFCLSSFAVAEDKKPTPEKLREMAAESMKRSDVKGARIIETQNLLVATTLPAAKAKSVAESLQRTFALAAKTLKFAETELGANRTIVYMFADLDNFRQFQRAILRVRPDEGEYAAYDVKRDNPYVAVSARRDDHNPNFALIAGNEICRALLAKKGGNARVAEWMKDGFAHAVQMRLNPRSVGADRAMVRRMAPRVAKNSKVKPVVDKAWSGTGREKDLVASSLMDYFTVGPGAEKFESILNGLIPTAGGRDPSFADALKAAEWTVPDLDHAWRDWVAKGSPASKDK